jgi:ABC-type multidrug transport system fused ATPase/permease subunit
MSSPAAAERQLEYRLADKKKAKLKSHHLLWYVIKRGAVSLHWYSAGLVVAVVQVVLRFLTPLPNALIVGSILPMVVDMQESSHALISVCIAWALLQILSTGVNVVYIYLTTEGSFNLILFLRRRFLGDLERMNEETKESFGLGRLYSSYTSDLSYYGSFYRDLLPTVLANLITVVATFLVIYLLSSTIFFVLILVIPLQILIMSFFRSRIRRAQSAQSRLRDEAMSMFNESLHNSDLIKSFDAAERMSDRTLSKVEAMIEQGRKARNQRMWWTGLSSLVSFGFTIGIALIAGLQVIEGTISLTFFMVITAYAERVLAPVRQLILVFQQIIPLMVAVQWCEEFFGAAEKEESTSRTEKLPIQSYEIEFRHVTFHYPDIPESARPALEDINFQVPQGKMTVLCGASGCGKSTVLKLMRGNLETQEGQVLVGGMDVRRIERQNLSRLMAYLSQRISLLSMSILQNAQLLSPQSGSEDLERALRMARIYDEIEAMEQETRVEVDDPGSSPMERFGRMIFGFEPRRVELMERRDGLDRLAGLSGNLSGGQQQRVSIAFALLTQCPVLLFDEPTSGLDKFSENELVETIAGLATADRTVVVVAHTLAPYFVLPDESVHFVFLDQGRLVGAGQRRELLQSSAEFRELARENVRHALALDRVDLELISAEGNA